MELKPCPFCGGKAEYAEGENYFVVEHDSWQCILADSSEEVFQIIENHDAVEWNERHKPVEAGRYTIEQIKNAFFEAEGTRIWVEFERFLTGKE